MKCYLCNAPTALLFRKSEFSIYRCRSCGLGITELGIPYDLFLKKQYEKGYFTGDPEKRAYVNYEKDKPYIVRNMKKLFNQIRKTKFSGRLLDVGAAMGYFVELVQKSGFDAYGFDPSAYAVGHAQKYVGEGRIKLGSVHSVTYPLKSFDVITMLDVFEHLADPASDLRKLSTFLKDDGIIVIATGDTGSIFAKLMGRRWTFYNPPQHLFFFDQKTLSTLLRDVGFQPVKWFRVGKWLSLAYVLHLAQTSGESVFAGIIYKRFAHSAIGRFPLYLPLQDNMVVIAKKVSSYP